MSRAKATGPFEQHFYVDEKLYGISPRGFELADNGNAHPSSVAFACPHCARVWARCPAGLPGGKPHPYQIVVHACSNCPTAADRGQGIYGSMVCSWLPEFVDAFPALLWRRELLHHLSLYP